MDKNISAANKIISNILRLSSGLSILLMTGGLVLFLFRSGMAVKIPIVRILGFIPALTGSLSLEPLSLMTLGIIVLIATPYFRVVGAFLSFLFIEKDRKYTLISFGVLLILTTSLFVPGIK